MKKKTKDSCGNCRFWNREGKDDDQADCRRHPPKVSDALLRADLDDDKVQWFELDDLVLHSIFPMTDVGGWCGEHERKR